MDDLKVNNPSQHKAIRGLVLDRDGTLIEHVPYLCDPEQVRLLPGVKTGLQRAINSGLLLFLHTNQSGVGRGYFELDKVHACNNAMIEQLGIGEMPFTKICIAPECPEADAIYRKPSNKFAVEILDQFGFAASELCYIGDRAIDLQTAALAGTKAVGVSTGSYDLNEELMKCGIAGFFPVRPSFMLAIELILAGEL